MQKLKHSRESEQKVANKKIEINEQKLQYFFKKLKFNDQQNDFLKRE